MFIYIYVYFLSQGLADNTVIAKVNKIVWDLDRPLEEDCTLELLKFEDEEAQAVSFCLIFIQGEDSQLQSFPAYYHCHWRPEFIEVSLSYLKSFCLSFREHNKSACLMKLRGELNKFIFTT